MKLQVEVAGKSQVRAESGKEEAKKGEKSVQEDKKP